MVLVDLEGLVDLVVPVDLVVEVLLEVDMEGEVLVEVEQELEDMLITERMIWGKLSRKFTSATQKQMKVLNPNRLKILTQTNHH